MGGVKFSKKNLDNDSETAYKKNTIFFFLELMNHLLFGDYSHDHFSIFL